MNERVYESEMPTFTTDVRMEKPYELFASSAGKGDRSQSVGSGGGGPVEAVWWISEVGMQWRMKGTAFVLGEDIEAGKEGESSGVRTAKSEVGSRMRVVEGKEGEVASWSWGKELTAHFGNCSPGMRGESRILSVTRDVEADLVGPVQGRGRTRHQEHRPIMSPTPIISLDRR